jgi:hypothetical protein
MAFTGSRTLRDAYPPGVRQYRGYITIPLPLWGLTLLVATLIALASSDSLLTFSCIAILPVLATLVWREGEPPVAFAAIMAQWLQVSTGTFRATADGVDLNSLFDTSGAVYATWLSLLGLLILTLGIRFANLNRPPMDTGSLRAELRSYRYWRVLAAYCLAQFVNLVIAGMIWYYPGLAQALLAATKLRWVFFFVLAVTTLVQKRGYGFLATAVGFEILMGFTSFFSDFRVVFFVLAVSYLMVQVRMSLRMISSLVLLTCVLVFFAVIWSAVKDEYRSFQNQGTGSQISMVGKVDELVKLGQLVSNIDSNGFLIGFDKLAQRVEYTKYFGIVTGNVPSFLPYDDGDIWRAAFYHVITPRILFPDKAELTADIVNTIHYTGIQFTGGGNETEIPLGYMAESYIDFGPVGMFVPILLLGLLLGLEYRFFATRSSNLVFAYALTPVVFMDATSYEITAIKILGGNLTVFLVGFLAWKFVIPFIPSWLRNSRRSA